MNPKDAARIANIVDPDQTAPPGAAWSGSALFAQTYLSENLGLLRYSFHCRSHGKYISSTCGPSEHGHHSPYFSSSYCITLGVLSLISGSVSGRMTRSWKTRLRPTRQSTKTRTTCILGCMVHLELGKVLFVMWAPSSEFVSSSIPSWHILTAHAQPFRGARDLAFCLKVPLDSLLVWASSEGSGETARMRRLAWTFAARIGDKNQIRLTRSMCQIEILQLTYSEYIGEDVGWEFFL